MNRNRAASILLEMVAIGKGAPTVVLAGAVLACVTAGPAAARVYAGSASDRLQRVAPATATPLHVRARDTVREFARWLEMGNARGFVGEVGWPGNPAAGGDERWNDVAAAFYAEAAKRRLWVSAWAAGEIWAGSYKLLVYSAPVQYRPVSAVKPQAAVLERQPAWWLRGVNVEQGAFGEFGAGYDPIGARSPLHNRDPGEYGRTYSYPGGETFAYLAARGVGFVRLPIRWERIQRSPGGALDAVELRRLAAAIDAAGRARLRVILDVHNYGAYYLFDGVTGRRRPIGSSHVTVADFADLWRRLGLAFGREPAVLGYGLMNEPVGLPGGARTWERAAQQAVSALRSIGDRRRVFVASYHWGGTWQFARHHPRGPWLHDPAGNTWYEGHAYFDGDRSGHYRGSYDAELAQARAASS